MTTNDATGAARIDTPGLAQEAVPSLDDFFEEPGGGNITPGWYGAAVLEGYATGKGTQFTTTDEAVSGSEGRRKLRFALGLNVNGTQRNLQKTFFYHPDDFKPENLARIKGLREQYGRNTWPGQGQLQRFSIDLTKLSQLERAIGFKLAKHPNGGFLVAPYVGKKLDVRVAADKKTGYDEAQAFAAAGTHSARK